ncbi:unnamed protein product [Microthlaspi erraticum]|uniref:Uncharacterized protein n=1 Tax=Microthlaspi erraticum TaxID=1685480 RepID=A0A6D2IKG0_9BRAS|nr:unnamed protein product [Microthlaspi erraticum]
MDFIKTSSLRALIELTFQRNWNGLIWMSRKGVTTKRVKTVQTALSRISAQTAQTGWPRITSVRLKSRPKFKTVGRSRITTRETCPAVGHATTTHATTAHDHAARAGKQSLAAAQPVSRTTADGAVRAGKLRPASGREFIGQSSSVRPQRPTTNPSGHDRSDRTSGHDPIIRPIVPTDRPNAAVDPKPVLKPVSHIFKARLNPKPPLKT